MIDAKIKDAKNRYCRDLVNNIFKESWSVIQRRIVDNSACHL